VLCALTLTLCCACFQSGRQIGGGQRDAGASGDGDSGGDGDTGGDGDGDVVAGDGDGDGDVVAGDGDGDVVTGDGDGDVGDGDGDGDGDTPACPSDQACDDGVFCNGREVCDPVAGCQPGAPLQLSDDVECTTDVCDELSDAIVHTPVAARCADGLWCNGDEICNPALGCQSSRPQPVDDSVACTVDACNEQLDVVTHQADNGLCDDGDACTLDLCDVNGGGCVSIQECSGIAVCGPAGELCDDIPWAFVDEVNGLVWAWASPCSGGCSTPLPSGANGFVMPGWRFPTDQDWVLRPQPSEWGGGLIIECAAGFFDPTYSHCDWGNVPVQMPDNSYNEIWFVHDLHP